MPIGATVLTPVRPVDTSGSVRYALRRFNLETRPCRHIDILADRVGRAVANSMACLNVTRLCRLVVGAAIQIAVTRATNGQLRVFLSSSQRGISWTGVQVRPIPDWGSSSNENEWLEVCAVALVSEFCWSFETSDLAQMKRGMRLASPARVTRTCRSYQALRSMHPVNFGFVFSLSVTGQLTSGPYTPPLWKGPDGHT
jgi:hypothetical protein